MEHPLQPYDFPPARPHGAITEVLPDVFTVTGTMRFPLPIDLLVSRVMTVVRDGGSLALINTCRLDEAGLAALDALGKVEHVVRLAAFHGSDDPFYQHRYGATVWAPRGQVYAKGFDPSPPADKAYFRADREMDVDGDLPLKGRLYVFRSVPGGESILVLDREGGIAISGDALQNWAPDPYMNWLGRLALRMMGFFRPCNVGQGWLKQMKPSADELRGVLDLQFEHVIPCHGAPVIGGAREKYRPAITAAAEWAARVRR